ncbi:MAG: hypothetical protein EPN69_05165 [Rhodanobacter sp.]|nr:MAG: hypothetical protein EPN69_05165 [Rhodanobacter sp.]TAM38073.1 MAG: hypothetical protein EPN58_18060 [Rhodanobacter sp.]TAN25321.1 MAG: hypothetical protein EPN32_10250 [Rhodanobacter sp.]
MQPANTLRFALNDRIEDAEVGPAHVPLALLGQFQKDVGEFLAGSGKDIDPNQVMIAIAEGSLVLVASGLLAAAHLWADVGQLQNPAQLGLIDPRRAAVVERWQAAARKNPHRRYTLADQNGTNFVRVDAHSDYRDQTAAVWVEVKKYLHGQITDLGGTSKANVHLRLDNGKVLIIASSQKLLGDEERNRLYKPAVLRISAEENLHNGELRNLTLLGFEDTPSTWDEAAFGELVRKGTQTWVDIPDDWLENLRSGQA